MEETKSILQFATWRSLAILDELGRGTSTFDGYSIAHAVMTHLVTKVLCRALFSTHYHMLLNDFQAGSGVQNYHMSFKEQNEQVIFLYKFAKGICPKSFGLNVARMAGVPSKVLDAAKQKSEVFGHKLD